MRRRTRDTQNLIQFILRDFTRTPSLLHGQYEEFRRQLLEADPRAPSTEDEDTTDTEIYNSDSSSVRPSNSASIPPSAVRPDRSASLTADGTHSRGTSEGRTRVRSEPYPYTRPFSAAMPMDDAAIATGRSADARAANARAADGPATTRRAADARAATGRSADARAADGPAATRRAADGRAATGRKAYAVARQLGFAPSVIDAYGWRPIDAQMFRGVLRLRTADGWFALKRAPLGSERIVWLDGLMTYAKRHGFGFTAPLVSPGNAQTVTDPAENAPMRGAKERQVSVSRAGDVYYATRWIDGQQPNFSSARQVGWVAAALAEFHEATRGYGGQGQAPDGEFNIAGLLRRRRRELRQWLTAAENRTHADAFEQILLELSTSLRDDADAGVQLAESDECLQQIREDRRRPGVCHFDVIPANFVLSGNHQVYLIDLDLAAPAPRVFDAAHLIRRSLQQLYWDPEAAYACFVAYNRVRPMTPAEYKLVQALLLFPHRPWRVAKARQSAPEAAQVDELRSYQLQENRRQQFLRAFTREIDLTEADE